MSVNRRNKTHDFDLNLLVVIVTAIYIKESSLRIVECVGDDHTDKVPPQRLASLRLYTLENKMMNTLLTCLTIALTSGVNKKLVGRFIIFFNSNTTQ